MGYGFGGEVDFMIRFTIPSLIHSGEILMLSEIHGEDNFWGSNYGWGFQDGYRNGFYDGYNTALL